VAASLGADVMLGKDPDCARWIKQFREPAPEGAIARGTGRRGGRRRRSAA
jgi:5-methyltetrahydrofolate--homocysteine methyltransferase